MIVLAFFAGCLVAALVLAEVDRFRNRDADLIRLDEHRAKMRAALTIAAPVQLHTRRDPFFDFLLGLPGDSNLTGEGRPAASPSGTSWSKVDRPTPVLALPVGTGEHSPRRLAAPSVGRALPELIAGSAGHASPRRMQQGAPRPPRHVLSAVTADTFEQTASGEGLRLSTPGGSKRGAVATPRRLSIVESGLRAGSTIDLLARRENGSLSS